MPEARLMSGHRIGPYRIDAHLGAGGMGEVYRAHDLKLGRDVAIKVLPASAASDPDRIAGLEREARLLATLNHPHIAAIYGLEESEGVRALVLELVEGPTLAERLVGGPMPVLDALSIAGQIAEALDTAHGKGIVHRDLKPANIKLTPTGQVKVLDFGLAKAFAGGGVNADPSALPTLTITREGMIVGTVGYMSPEQARGLSVDKRTDIWAFGCVLYEMLTGRVAFAGPTVSDAIAAILEREPDWRALPRKTPVRIQQLLRRCLEKDLTRRLRDIGDAVFELRLEHNDDSAVAAKPSRPWVLGRGMLGLIAVGLVLLTAFLTTLVSDRPATTTARPSPIRFSIPPPPGTRFGSTLSDGETTSIALSPDGSQLAFVATDEASRTAIWIRPLSMLEAHPVAGTDGAISMFWSPDGRSLGFFAGGKLKRIDLPDGTPTPLTDVPTGAGLSGTWGANGEILFASVLGTQIFRASTAGGPPVPLIKGEPSGRETRLYWPRFLPDGRRFLYVVRHDDGTEELRLFEPGRPPQFVMSVVSNVEWVDPGYLVFASEGTLLGQRFDPLRPQGIGAPFAIAQPVDYVYMPSRAQFTTSHNGMMVYQAHRDRARLVWIDRTGRELETVGEPSGYYQLRISPDGKRVLLSTADSRFGTNDLWTIELARRVATRLTSDPRQETAGVWLPSGSAIVFSAARRTMPNLFQRDLATGTERELLPSGTFQMASDVTRDGKLVFSQRTERGDSKILTMPLDNATTPSPALANFVARDGRLSPDGRAIAFLSRESSRLEVYVAPFPVTDLPTRVSTDGGSDPRWRRDGRELFYLTSDKKLMSVPVRTIPSLVVGTARALFALPGRRWADFDVSIDGDKFLAIVPDIVAREQPLTAIVNWPVAIKQEAGQPE